MAMNVRVVKSRVGQMSLLTRPPLDGALTAAFTVYTRSFINSVVNPGTMSRRSDMA